MKTRESTLTMARMPLQFEPGEEANLESFLDSHVRAFEYFGGVPRRIAYDNLKCAVIQVDTESRVTMRRGAQIRPLTTAPYARSKPLLSNTRGRQPERASSPSQGGAGARPRN